MSARGRRATPGALVQLRQGGFQIVIGAGFLEVRDLKSYLKKGFILAVVKLWNRDRTACLGTESVQVVGRGRGEKRIGVKAVAAQKFPSAAVIGISSRLSHHVHDSTSDSSV